MCIVFAVVTYSVRIRFTMHLYCINKGLQWKCIVFVFDLQCFCIVSVLCAMAGIVLIRVAVRLYCICFLCARADIVVIFDLQCICIGFAMAFVWFRLGFGRDFHWLNVVWLDIGFGNANRSTEDSEWVFIDPWIIPNSLQIHSKSKANQCQTHFNSNPHPHHI